MRLNNTVTTGVLDWGPAGDGTRPHANRYMKVVNASGKDLFLPENTAAEKNSVFNYLSASGVTVKRGQYFVGSTLYNNKAEIGTGPCWIGNSNSAAYNAPPACDAGWTTGSLVSANNVNPNTYNGNASILHGTAAWMFYQVYGWGCGSGAIAKVQVRYCTA